jgi:hypothetical protein
MTQTKLPSEPTPESSPPDLMQALKDHLYKAELLVYCSLLLVGVIQIVVREQFPQLKPPWPWIVGPLMVGLLGYVVIPPIILVTRFTKS